MNHSINIDILKKAINNTFSKRNSFKYLRDFEKIMESIIVSERVKMLWNSYSKKHDYAKNIELNQIIIILKSFIKKLNLNFCKK